MDGPHGNKNGRRKGYPQRVDPKTGEHYYLHRAFAAMKLGRPLQPGEVVHYANNDHRDYHPDNIWVFSSQRAHMLYHNYMWRHERGIRHLYPIEKILEVHGEWVIR